MEGVEATQKFPSSSQPCGIYKVSLVACVRDRSLSEQVLPELKRDPECGEGFGS